MPKPAEQVSRPTAYGSGNDATSAVVVSTNAATAMAFSGSELTAADHISKSCSDNPASTTGAEQQKRTKASFRIAGRGMAPRRRSAWSVADFTATLPKGWTVQYGHVYQSNRDQDDEFGFYAVVVDSIFADPCVGSDSGELIEVGPGVDDLAAALLRQPGPIASSPIDTTLGGYPAIRIDLTVPEGADLEACNMSGIGLQIWYSRPADKYFVLLADGIASVYILDVGGERQVFMTQHASSTSVEDLAELQTLLDSIRIET